MVDRIHTFTGIVVIVWIIYGIQDVFSSDGSFIRWLGLCLLLYIFLNAVRFFVDSIHDKERQEKEKKEVEEIKREQLRKLRQEVDVLKQHQRDK